PIREVIKGDFPALRHLASLDKGDYMAPIITRISKTHTDNLVLTFDHLTQDKNFITLMQQILSKLERYHKMPVDIEFAVSIKSQYPQTEYTIHLLQCRPLVSKKQIKNVEIPSTISATDLIFQTTKLVPQGIVYGVRYIVNVPASQYSQAPDYETKTEIVNIISSLNKILASESFILIGPGRWGSSEADLGVRVTYADIFNTKVLIEVPLQQKGSTAEPSYGTHFFQDLVETGIYPLPIDPRERDASLNTAFLNSAPNKLEVLLPEATAYAQYVKVIDIPEAAAGRYLDIIMNDEEERAIGYLTAKK
ncbi:MAG: PEP/pyruvate-binding domain-containing protein, partial [Anaerolineae bacterium]|nr:PEP/pyruvate-binding domain-containing protein [Anaerolineae bacterium]